MLHSVTFALLTLQCFAVPVTIRDSEGGLNRDSISLDDRNQWPGVRLEQAGDHVDNRKQWSGIASSSDGMKLVAVVGGKKY
jgi:hypothetical protein